jgi:signal transduction histidine kinase
MTDTPPDDSRFPQPQDPTPDQQAFSPEELAFLQAVRRRVSAAVSLDEIMSFFFEAALNVDFCDRACLAFLEDDGQRISAYWVRANYSPILLESGFTMDVQATSLGAIQKQDVIRVIDDLEAYLLEHPDSEATELLVREGIRSSMTYPLAVDGRIVGLLFMSSRIPHAFDHHKRRMLQAVAERISQAVDKTYRIEQLTAVNHAYLEMLDFVSHELKNPLASMIMDGELLVGGYLGELEPEQTYKVGRMILKAKHLLNLVREYLVLSRIEGHQLEAKMRPDVDFVAAVLEPAKELVAGELDAKEVRLVQATGGDLARVECDPYLLRIALANLLGNAIKFGTKGGEIRLRVEKRDFGMLVSVWNEGVGFSERAQSRLFRKFSRLETPALQRQKGTGVGLYITWQIVMLHQGQIWARSEEGAWAEFTIEFPQPLRSGGR